MDNENIPPARPPRQLQVVIVLGVDTPAVALAARGLRRPVDSLLLYSVEHADVGMVSRVIESPQGSLEPGIVDMAADCLSCTIRADLLATLLELAGKGLPGVVVQLPAEVEAAPIVADIHEDQLRLGSASVNMRDYVSLHSVVTVVRGGTLLDDVGDPSPPRTGTESHEGRGRGLLLGRQLECADLVIPFDANARSRALIRLINPDALLWADPRMPEAPLHDHAAFQHRVDTTLPLDGPSLRVEADLWSLNWRADRPLHPDRLASVIDEMAGSVLRGRGELWLASRLDAVVTWESSGTRLNLAHLGSWTAAGRCGLTLVGTDDDPHRIATLLDQALVTELEFAKAQRGWPGHDEFIDLWQDGSAAAS